MKKKEGFHSPFEVLKDISLSPPAEKKVAPKKDPEIDEDIFVSAMQGVRPMSSDTVELPLKQRAIKKTPQEDQIARDALDALVKGKARFDITLTGEYAEGYVRASDPCLVIMLKDGLTANEARPYLEGFIHKAYMNGLRTLLIIHGRGLKSEAEPVLKNSVIRWITSGRLSHKVLAFCSARPCDGGTGALYVLLKAKARKAKWVRNA